MKMMTMKSIGEKYYNFNIQKELIIYKYLCKTKYYKKKFKKLQSDLKFDTYCEWENYVKEKHKDLSDEKLLEFSKFLNLQKRNERPVFEMMSWLMPAVFSVYINICVDIAYKDNNSLFSHIFIIIISYIFFILIAREIIKPLLDECSRDNFFDDYKEIIDNLIKERKEK